MRPEYGGDWVVTHLDPCRVVYELCAYVAQLQLDVDIVYPYLFYERMRSKDIAQWLKQTQ